MKAARSNLALQDLYASTHDALGALYPRLSPGGVVLIDDYGSFAGCAVAVDEYRAGHNITAPLRKQSSYAPAAGVSKGISFWRFSVRPAVHLEHCGLAPAEV